METKIVPVSREKIDKEVLKEAGEILKEGGLVAFPTETVYGLGGDALNQNSSRKIYAAKGRPSDNPLIVHICRWEDIYPIVSQKEEDQKKLKIAKKIAEVFWPGPLTMILPKSDLVPPETTGGLETVAVRFPSDPVAQMLIDYAGGYVAAPSANTSGKPSPTLAKYVAEDMDGRIEMILDGGEVGIGIESTIIDLTVEPPQILRPGYITHDMLSEVLGRVEEDITLMQGDTGQAPKAPGMKYRHYAPKGELIIVSGDQEAVAAYINEEGAKDSAAGEKVGVIATMQMVQHYRAPVVKSIGSREDELAIARNLYTILREFDEEQVTKIYSESFDTQGFGQAIMNRLLKAAGYKIISL